MPYPPSFTLHLLQVDRFLCGFNETEGAQCLCVCRIFGVLPKRSPPSLVLVRNNELSLHFSFHEDRFHEGKKSPTRVWRSNWE